jgi:hypothetical protein
MTCVDCHAAATTSYSSVDNLLPGEAACKKCHAIERDQPEKVAYPSARCDACHAGYVAGQPPARVYIPPPNLKFTHANHLARNLACTNCHDMEGVGLATRDQLPQMEFCLERCHDGKKAPKTCTTCHLAEVGVVDTTFEQGAMIPQNHGGDFTRNHARDATRDAGYCESCHRESDCADCHTGVVKPDDFHPLDYIEIHEVDARRNDPDCSTCHRQQTFCVGCHERSGIGTRDTDYDQDDPTSRFHPEDWVDVGHARQARANLNACASCHREDDCLECHSAETGTPRLSPHGAGWRGSYRCESLSSKNPRMCLRCHTDPDEQGCDW